MTVAKFVIYQTGRGHWWEGRHPDPDWTDGVYVWMRANDEPGDMLAKEIERGDFVAQHGTILERFMRDRHGERLAVSAAPNPLEHFWYFQFDPARDNPDQIVEIFTFCSQLGST
jgi:hypothetical protein